MQLTVFMNICFALAWELKGLESWAHELFSFFVCSTLHIVGVSKWLHCLWLIKNLKINPVFRFLPLCFPLSFLEVEWGSTMLCSKTFLPL